MKRLLAIAILLTAGCRAGDATVSRTGLRESTEPGSANPTGLAESGSVRAPHPSPPVEKSPRSTGEREYATCAHFTSPRGVPERE